MKTEYTEKLARLEAKLSASNSDDVNIKELLNNGISNLLELDGVYEKGTIEKKREVISSMYPEKMTFDGFTLRTTRINEAIRLIYTLGKGLKEIKMGQNGIIPFVLQSREDRILPL